MEQIKNKKKERLVWIDCVKGLCMFMVIISHISFSPEFLRKIYSPWFLTGFFFCTGYLYKDEYFKSFLGKKFKTLIIPWIVFGFFEIITLVVFGSKNYTFLEYCLFDILQVKGYNETLWFLPCLFLSLVYVYFLKKIANKYLLLISFLLLIASRLYGVLMPNNIFPWGSNFLPWHIHIIFTVGFFIILGHLYKIKLENKLFSNRVLTLIIASIVYLVALFFSWNDGAISIWDYPNIFEWLAIMFSGLFIILYLGKRGIFYNKILEYIGRNSLLFYVLHQTICRIFVNIFTKIELFNYMQKNWVGQTIITLILVSAVLLTLYFPIEFIKKKMPFLIGQKNNI